jgi:hypothetical protein
MMNEPMMNDRLPESIQSELASIIHDVVEDLSHSTSHFVDQLGDFQLVEVFDDDSAIVEITPRTTGDPTVDPASIVYPRRRKLAPKYQSKTAGRHGVLSITGRHQEHDRD